MRSNGEKRRQGLDELLSFDALSHLGSHPKLLPDVMPDIKDCCFTSSNLSKQRFFPQTPTASPCVLGGGYVL